MDWTFSVAVALPNLWMMLNEINYLTNGVNPESIMTDFKSAMLTKGCTISVRKRVFFHLTKSIYRIVKKFGLSQEYLNNEQFRSNITMIGAFSFVPRYCRYYSGIYRIANHANAIC